MKSSKLFRIFLLLSISTLFFNCNNKKSNKYINVHFIQSGTTFPVSMDCKFNGNENEQTGDLFYKKITDESFINTFYEKYKKLEVNHENKNSPNNRIMAFVHYENRKIDTLCFGENNGIMLNGIRMNDSPELLSHLKDKIDYHSTFKTKEEILNNTK